MKFARNVIYMHLFRSEIEEATSGHLNERYGIEVRRCGKSGKGKGEPNSTQHNRMYDSLKRYVKIF